MPQTTMIRTKNSITLSELKCEVLDDSLCCRISLDIMDSPVIDPTSLNAEALAWYNASSKEKVALNCGNFKDVPRFELTILKQILTNGKKISPLTREPLTVDQLIPDTKLKFEIDFFMLLQKEQKSRADLTRKKELEERLVEKYKMNAWCSLFGFKKNSKAGLLEYTAEMGKLRLKNSVQTK